jgi:hypothetical protein
MAICFSEFFNEVFVVAHLSYQKSGKALADVMNAEYSRDENDMKIKVNTDQISNYFEDFHIVRETKEEKHDEHVICSCQLHDGENHYGSSDLKLAADVIRR